jgi:GH24 family phage-related lysozyme (muramidase)
MRARLKVSRAGVELIKSFEGLRQTAARLPDGRWTLGYGHTFSAREGATVTQEDADALLRFDLLPVVDAINNLVLTPLNQNQFDALVSFCFNIGNDNFAASSVLKRINEGRMTEAALAMDSWRSAEFNGQTYVLAPLIRRRAAEKNLFLTPDEIGGNAPSLLIRPVEDGMETGASPSEIDAPTNGGILSARPLAADPITPALSTLPPPYAAPVAPTPVPTPPESPAFSISATPVSAMPERQVIDLASFAPRPVETPVSEPTAFTPKPTIVRMADVEPTPIVPQAPVEQAPTSFDADPLAAMSPEMQQAIARAQEELRAQELRMQEEVRQREDAQRLEQQRAEAARLEQVRQEQIRLEQARIEQERLQREEQIRAEMARAEAARLEQQRLEREAQERVRLEFEAQERQRQEQLRLEQEAQERARLEQERVERERQEQMRLEQERQEQARLEQARLDQERLERERLEAERVRLEAQRAEEARQAEIRLEAERMERERQEQAKLEQEKLEKARREQAAVQQETSTGVSPEEAEKARKAEAAAALMRLYSPYGGGRLGMPLNNAKPTPLEPFQPVAEPVREVPVEDTPPSVEISREPEAVKPTEGFHFSPSPLLQAVPDPESEPVVKSSEPIHLQFRPQPSASSMPAPQITALNPYARPIPQADVVEVPRPSPVDLSSNPAVFRSETPPQSPEQPLHWREQLQRPLPNGYHTPEPEAPAATAAATPLRGVQTAMYDDNADDWHPDSGRIALSAEEMEQETVSVWRMITSTVWWILISAAGLACLGVASGAYFKATQESAGRAGVVTFYTWLSIGSAAAGILLVCVSVWLIMKRLGGLKD